MLNLQVEAERAARYRRYARYALAVAWGLVIFSLTAIAITAWSYYTFRLELRVDVIVVTAIFFASPPLLGFWIYEACLNAAYRSSSRALRITNGLLQARITSLVSLQCPDLDCRHCKTFVINKRADALMAAWDAKHPRKPDDGG